MRRLYLLRHGHSPSVSEAGVRSDEVRPLSERGRADARAAAEDLRRRGGRPSLLLHSPLLRAVQTAQAAAEALGLAAEPFQPLDNVLSPEEALRELRARAGASGEVLAVGHQPQVGEIAALLTGAALEVRPAGLVAVELEPQPRLLWARNPGEPG